MRDFRRLAGAWARVREGATARGLAVVTAMVLASGACSAAQPYRDARLPVEARVSDLLERMTPEEKFWQLFMLAGSLEDGPRKYTHGAFGFQIGPDAGGGDAAAYVDSIQRHFVNETRLGIPIIAFAEALHGLVRGGATAFPQSIGLAATFDTSLVREVSAQIARECRASGIRMVLSPVVNIASDVRWGRVEETYGEDPYLASAMGVAFVSEFERRGIVTTPKHCIANAGEGGRDSYPIHVSERLLREIYLPPFAACIARGGSRAVMAAYNSLDGTPCSASAELNNHLLREDLGFTGVVISDAGGVGGANVLHFTAADYAEAAAKALSGGLDVIFQTSFDHASLFRPPFLDGRIAPEVIDRAVARVLRLKFELGLFDHPYAGSAGAGEAAPSGELSRALARRAAQSSLVLLKNERRTLPLRTDLETLVVLGPDAAEARLGGYSRPAGREVSILEGIQSRLGSGRVRHARGCSRVAAEYETVPAEYLSWTRGDSVGPGLLGAYFDNITLSGEPVLTRVDPRLQFQWTLFSPDPERLPYDFYSVRWTGRLRGPADGPVRIGIEGNDGYRLYLDGVSVIDNWRKVTCRSVLADFTFQRDRLYDLRVEYFEPTGNARLRLVWDQGPASPGGMPPPAGQPRGEDSSAGGGSAVGSGRAGNGNAALDADAEMDAAVRLAAQGDAVVVVAGIEEGEFRDRAFLALPGRQEELIQRVAAIGKPVVVVLVGGSAVTMRRWLDSVPAVLAVWYPGEAGGEAVADALFGDCNPAGRLPITFPVAEGQLPLVYNHKPTGRGDDYLDLTGQPLFPFGHGLSYTTFAYSDLELGKCSLAPGDSTTIRCRVRNTGEVAGEEVVQLYVRDEFASVARPVMELKGFRRVRLEPKETRTVEFAITPAMLSFPGPDLTPVVEPGRVRLMIGASSKEIRLRGTLLITE